MNTIKVWIIEWLLSSPAATRALVEFIVDHPVMDRYVQEIADSAAEDEVKQLEYSDITGLEEFVDREIKNIDKPDVYAEDVIGLDRYVNDRVRS